jgi:hypothetical protein
MRNLQTTLANATLRMDKVIVLAGALTDPECPCNELSEFLECEDEETLRQLFPTAPNDLFDEGASNSELTWQFCEWLSDSGTLGVLVQFATPVMRRTSRKFVSFSWGYYYAEWVYAETFKDAVEKGLSWAAKKRAQEDRDPAHGKGGAA